MSTPSLSTTNPAAIAVVESQLRARTERAAHGVREVRPAPHDAVFRRVIQRRVEARSERRAVRLVRVRRAQHVGGAREHAVERRVRRAEHVRARAPSRGRELALARRCADSALLGELLVLA